MTEFGAEMDARERALRAERDALRSEAEGLRAALAAAEAEIGRLSRPPCLHPVELVRDGVCECGADVW